MKKHSSSCDFAFLIAPSQMFFYRLKVEIDTVLSIKWISKNCNFVGDSTKCDFENMKKHFSSCKGGRCITFPPLIPRLPVARQSPAYPGLLPRTARLCAKLASALWIKIGLTIFNYNIYQCFLCIFSKKNENSVKRM